MYGLQISRKISIFVEKMNVFVNILENQNKV